jgi:magnesium transporter
MKTQLTAKSITWHDIESPDGQELAEFVRATNLDRLDAEFIVQNHHRPEIAMRDAYVLLLLQVPTFDKKLRITYGVPLYILILEREVYTLHYEPIPLLARIVKDFTETPAKQEEYFDDTALSLALTIINNLHNGEFAKLERLQKHIEIVADAVFHGNERKMVEEIAVLNRDVMDFRSIMRPQRNVFATDPEHSFFDKESLSQWRRLHGQMQRLWDILESLSEKVHELGQTNDSLLQHKENQLLHVLTIYSIIAIPAFILVAPLNLPEFEIGSGMSYAFMSLVAIFTLLLVWIFLRAKGLRR